MFLFELAIMVISVSFRWVLGTTYILL